MFDGLVGHGLVPFQQGGPVGALLDAELPQQVTAEPVLQIDQPWEHINLFYPYVVKVGGAYVMWYGSYWRADTSKTALGLAVSQDGLHWTKGPNNPVFGPDESRAWETNYTTSQTVLPLADGRWRIWYASRCSDFQAHKYFAIATAVCDGPKE